MRYVSTRGGSPALGFEEVMLAGLAPDGGLYVPERWPRLEPAEIAALRNLSYPELVTRVAEPFCAGEVGGLLEAAREAYAGFDSLVPLTELGDDLWLLELFWGPTLAFKDYALQLLGRLVDDALVRRGRRAIVLGATSGDTGSAAIEACRDRESVDIVVLHPAGRVSEVQRRQMTTVLSPNVHNVAIRGTFDDCQRLVKGLLGDPVLRGELSLTSANSINWVRILGQVAYYFAAAVALGSPERPVSFAVPTGNFGNVFSAYAAMQMGLPVDRLIVGTNRNNVVARFLQHGRLQAETVVPTITPAMDIQVPSNLERLLFDLHGRDPDALRSLMSDFQEQGRAAISAERLEVLGRFMVGAWSSEEVTRQAIATAHERYGVLLDPHTAIGFDAAGAVGRREGVPVVCLGTAHPAKFPEAVTEATGVRPSLPSRLADLADREERFVELAADQRELEALVRAVMG